VLARGRDDLKEFHLGSRTLQPHRQLLADGQRVALGKRALDILSVLARARGEIVTKDELLEAVWPDVTVEENALQVHIVALRKALGPEADRLETIRGVGYQLVLDGAVLPHDTAVLSSTITSSTISVVILPFANLSGDSEQAYFAEGISEDIATDLSKVSSLTVLNGRGSVQAREKNGVDAKAIARQFQASHILEGSVRKSGNRIRLSAQLKDGETAANIWAERYDREMSDIFALQDELSQKIVEALKLRLLPGEKEAMHSRATRNPDAYDYYLQARALRATMDFDCIRRSVDAYRRALDADPNFAKARAGLATALLQNRSHFGDASGVVEEDIREALHRASQLAPDLPDVLASRAQYGVTIRDWDTIDDCIAGFRRLEQSDWSVFSHLLLIRGYPVEALRHQRKVFQSDPLSPGGAWGLQYHLDCAWRFDEAEVEYRKSKTLPGGQLALDWEAVKRMLAMGAREGVREKILECIRSPGALGDFGPELADVLDDKSEATQLLKRHLAALSEPDPLLVLSLSHIAVYLGDEALALDALRIANIKSRGVLLMDVWHPIFANLRSHPAFKSLLVEIGLIDHCRKTGEWGEFIVPADRSDFMVVTAPPLHLI
jgi:TolB-like protein